jgi:hypothetical protein
MKQFIIEKPSTNSPVVVTDNFPGNDRDDLDIFFRIRSDNTTQKVYVAYADTKTVRDDLNAYGDQCRQDVDLLCSVILWQKKTIDYQALHTAFLLNSLSEEAFEKEAEKFIIHQKEVPPKMIASMVGRLVSLIGNMFDTSDYADYFRCTQQNVMTGLSLIPHKHFSKMLPSSAEIE